MGRNNEFDRYTRAELEHLIFEWREKHKRDVAMLNRSIELWSKRCNKLSMQVKVLLEEI